MEFVSGAEEALHHERVGGRVAHVVLAQELQQVLPVSAAVRTKIIYLINVIQ